MQLGISSWTYTWAIGVPGQMPPEPMTAAGLLDRAGRLGVRRVQIADNLPLDALSPAELDSLERQSRRIGVEIEVGTRGIALDHLRRYLDLARRFGSPILRVVVDKRPHHPEPDEVVDTLRPFVPELEAAGVTLAIENHDRFRAATIADVIRRIGSPRVGVCLDTVNSFGALEGPDVVVRALGPYTVNLHVKEFVVTRASHMMGFAIEGRPAGQGMLNVPWLLDELRAMDRDPTGAIIEQWTPPEATLAATIEKEHRWATDSVEYLRRLIPQ
jgi:sugar phosphate isomerase/epimerase